MLSVILVACRPLPGAVMATVLGSALSAFAEIPRVLWETTVQSDQQDFELHAAAMSPDTADVWLGVAARPRGRIGAPEQVLVTSISAKGAAASPMIEMSSDSRLSGPVERRALQGIAPGVDGQLLVGLSLRSTGSTLATLASQTGRFTDVRAWTFDSGKPEIARLVPLHRNRLLAVGALGTRPFVAEMDASGKTVWQRALVEENVNLDSGAPTADGGMVVTGRKGIDPASTRVWLAKLSATGAVERKAEFDGWLGSVAQGVDGGYLLVTVGRGRDAKVTLLGLDGSLQQRWVSAMPAGQPTTPNFRVSAIPGGDFVVAGVKERGLWMARVGSGGALVWTEARVPKPPAVEVAINVELLARNDAFIALYTVFGVEGKQQRQYVRALRFAP